MQEEDVVIIDMNDENLNLEKTGRSSTTSSSSSSSSSGPMMASSVSLSSINQVGLNIQNRIRSEMAAAAASASAAAMAADNRSLDRSRGSSMTTAATIQRRIAESDTLSERSKRFLTDYIERLEELIWVYSKSSEYYERRNFYITTPSIILTSVSGIVSLLSASNSTGGGGGNTFHYSSAVAVGVIAAVSSVFQALSSTLKYGTKCELHREVADRYSKIITSIQFEFIEHTDAHFISLLEKQILEVQNLCKYLPPMFLFEQYKKHLELMGKCSGNGNGSNGV